MHRPCICSDSDHAGDTVMGTTRSQTGVRCLLLVRWERPAQGALVKHPIGFYLPAAAVDDSYTNCPMCLLSEWHAFALEV